MAAIANAEGGAPIPNLDFSALRADNCSSKYYPVIANVKKWLRKRSLLGLLIAYLVTNGAIYGILWAIFEPAGIPDRIQNFSEYISNRWLLQIALTQLMAAPLTLVIFWKLMKTEGGVHKELYKMKLESLKTLRNGMQGILDDLRPAVQQKSLAPSEFRAPSIKEFTEMRVKLRFFEEIAHSCDSRCADLVKKIMLEVNTRGDRLVIALDTTAMDPNTLAGIEAQTQHFVQAIEALEKDCQEAMRAAGYD